jgi:ABC-2 type transport system ATP-binding protein
MQYAITTCQLEKSFNGKEVIHESNMSVEYGTIYGLLGRNGAGKTTIFKLLLGLLKPTYGKATVLGLDSVKENSVILRKTGSLIDVPVFYEHLSAIENLQLHLDYMGVESGDIDETLHMVGLSNAGNETVSNFSMGMRQRLAIARAIVHKPELLILDEPVNGLDPVGIREMRELFCSLSKENKMTIILSSHILSEVEQIVDRIGFIVDGTIVQEISPNEIKKRYSKNLEDYFIEITDGGHSYE